MALKAHSGIAHACGLPSIFTTRSETESTTNLAVGYAGCGSVTRYIADARLKAARLTPVRYAD